MVGSELLAATDTGKIHCFDLKSLAPSQVLLPSTMAITSLCVFSNNEAGETLCVGSLDATLKLYSYPEKKLKKHVQLEEKVQCMEAMWGYIFMGSDRGHLTRYNSDVRLLFLLTSTIIKNIYFRKINRNIMKGYPILTFWS